MKNYTTNDIKTLREETGAGMLAVNKALMEADGDHDKARDLLRAQGLTKALKRVGLDTQDGLVAVHVEDGVGTIMTLACETDFVSKSDTFKNLADEVLTIAVNTHATKLQEALADRINTVSGTVGENIQVKDVKSVTGGHVATYLHKTSPELPPQIGVIVAISAAGTIGTDMAMHIAAMNPTYLDRKSAPAGHPSDDILVEQAYVKEPDKTVGEKLNEADATILQYVRNQVGE